MRYFCVETKLNYMRKLFIILSVVILAISCSDNSVQSALDEAEAYISVSPEQSLHILDSLNEAGVHTGRNKAEYALLYSMALDKNYIDSTNDSLINIAVSWYEKHGSADEKLKAYYYQGRVYQNAGDNESAMLSFAMADKFAKQAEDKTTAGLLYLALSKICMHIFDTDKALDYCNKAITQFEAAEDFNRSITAAMKLTNCYSVKNDFASMATILDSVYVHLDNISSENKNVYHIMRMSLFKDTGNQNGLSESLEEYINSFDEDEIDWLSVSDYYIVLGNASQALMALSKYRNYNTDYYSNPVYYIIEFDIYENLGMPDKTLDAYKRYVEVSDSIDLVIFRQDTKFIKEKYEKDLLLSKEHNEKIVVLLLVIIAIILIVSVSLFSISAIRKRDAEKTALKEEIRRNEENYRKLSEERAELAEVLAESSSMDNLSKKVVKDRLELLNRFFTAEISGNGEIDRKAGEELHRIVQDRDTFLYTTRMTFAAAHPGFIAHLEEKGLDDKQIETCCLYAIGLKGKEIASYTKRARHYMDSSDIRARLGMKENESTLAKHLKSLLGEE